MLRNQTLLSILFIFFLTLSLSYSTLEDKSALLAFKASSDLSGSLSSWAESTNPCAGSWLGVTCDPKTSRVTKLVLEKLNLAGSIQPLTGLDHISVLSLKHNLLSSSLNLSASASSWSHLNHLYLSHNNFTGPIPTEIFRLRHLRRLDLSHNHLSGEIPVAELARLPNLLTLMLESNSLTGFAGSAPNASAAAPFTDFNVSNNNLAGKIPQFLEKFGTPSFSGNEKLCGKPLPHDCPEPTAVNPVKPSSLSPTPPPESKPHHRKRNVFISASAAVIGIVVLVGGFKRWQLSKKPSQAIVIDGGGIVNGSSYVKRNFGSHSYGCGPNGSVNGGGARESEDLVVLDGCNPGVGKVGDLLRASAELLGKGSVGSTYKIKMNGRDDAVVVKRVRERRVQGKEMEARLRMVGDLNHTNIARLRAFHNSNYELLLVYDFYANGSLHSLLHGIRGPGTMRLDWTTRLRLASGCAQGLDFIHSCDKSGKLYHGHFNSSNVLIDQKGNACIADIALRQLLVTQTSANNNAYKAPELMPPSSFGPNKYTPKCDVYSFGVVLMEILTGRTAAEEGDIRLSEWVNMVVKKQLSTWEVFDFVLSSDKEMEEDMWSLFQVGLLCLAPQPKDRPLMNHVYSMIEGIRKKGVREDGTKSVVLDDYSFGSSSTHSQSTP